MGLKLDAAEAAVRSQAGASGRPADKPANAVFRKRQVRESRHAAQQSRAVALEPAIALGLKVKSAAGPANPGEPVAKRAEQGRFKPVGGQALPASPGSCKGAGDTTLPGMHTPSDEIEHLKQWAESSKNLLAILSSLNRGACGPGAPVRHRQTPSAPLDSTPQAKTEQSPHQLSAVVPAGGRASKSRGAPGRPERSPTGQLPMLDEQRSARHGKPPNRRAGAESSPSLSPDTTYQLRKAEKGLCREQDDTPLLDPVLKAPTSTGPARSEPSSSACRPIPNFEHYGRPRKYYWQCLPGQIPKLMSTDAGGTWEEEARRKQAEIEERRAAYILHFRQLRLADANGHFCATFPGVRGESVHLINGVVPGSALGERIPPVADSRSQSLEVCREYRHPPRLTQTALRDANGQTIYSGLHHGALDPQIGTFRWSDAATEAEKSQALRDLLPDDHPYNAGRDYSEEQINALRQRAEIGADQFERTRRDRILTTHASVMNDQAARNMAREVAAAALAADPERLRQALDMQAVCLKLFHVALKPHDCPSEWQNQESAFAALEADSPVAIQVRGADGRPRTVRVDIKIRQFNLDFFVRRLSPVYAGYGSAYDPLLGAAGPGNRLGGDVMARIRELNAASADIRSRVHSLEMDLERLDRSSKGDQVCETVRTLKNELSRMEKNSRALREAGEQLNHLRNLRLSEVDPEQMGARLALVGHLMGETPILTACRTGAAKTLHLDAAAKFLAAVASAQGGYVPTVETQQTPEWVRAYESFRAQLTREPDYDRSKAIEAEFSRPGVQIARGF